MKRALPAADTVKAAIDAVLEHAAASRTPPLRRTLELYEEDIRQLTLENDALRSSAAVIPLPVRAGG